MFKKIRLWMLEQQVKAMIAEQPQERVVVKKAPAKKAPAKKAPAKKKIAKKAPAKNAKTNK
jgi:histone H1/5